MKFSFAFIFIVFCLFQACTSFRRDRSYRYDFSVAEIDSSELSGFCSIIAGFNREFDARVGSTIPGAVILFIRDGEIYFKQAFGYKNLGSGTRMTTDAIFRVALISKTVSAIGVMKLVEYGVISLDEPVANLMKNLQIPDTAFYSQSISFRNLLTHTSGISDHMFNFLAYSTEHDLQYIFDTHEPSVFVRAPGERFLYSNVGFHVLLLAMEGATGKNFTDLMAYYVLRPMKMQNSTFEHNLEVETRLATPYDRNLFMHSPLLEELFAASGGLYTTAGDLAHLVIQMMMVYHGKENNFILSQDSLKKMFSREVIAFFSDTMTSYWGLGFSIEQHSGNIFLHGHRGTTRGYNTAYWFCLDSKDGIIILTNGTRGHSELIEPLRLEWIKYLISR